jgi:hypothetical protein
MVKILSNVGKNLHFLLVYEYFLKNLFLLKDFHRRFISLISINFRNFLIFEDVFIFVIEKQGQLSMSFQFILFNCYYFKINQTC